MQLRGCGESCFLTRLIAVAGFWRTWTLTNLVAGELEIAQCGDQSWSAYLISSAPLGGFGLAMAGIRAVHNIDR